MKRFFLFLLLFILALAALIFFIALPKAKMHIENALKDAGFTYAQASEVHFKPTGMVVENINIDADGFSKITNLKANIFWPTYFFEKEIDSLNIQYVNIISSDSSLNDFPSLKRKLNLKQLDKHQIQKVSVNHISWDFPLYNYAIRVEGNLDISRDSQGKKISMNIDARQHELTFSTKWKGRVNDNGDHFLNSTIEGFQLNLPSLSLHRSTGWFSYKNENDTTDLSGQLDAGSGAIFNLPAKNISFILGKNDQFYPVIIRAYAAGIENVRMSSDIQLSKETIYQNGQIKVTIPNFQKFLDYLKSQKIINISPIATSEQVDMSIALMPKRRFAGGPLPFKVKITRALNPELEGTLLIYPDTLDVRGSMKTNDDFIGIIKSLTPVNDNQIKENIIHLDTNLKPLIF